MLWKHNESSPETNKNDALNSEENSGERSQQNDFDVHFKDIF